MGGFFKNIDSFLEHVLSFSMGHKKEIDTKYTYLSKL